MGPSTPRCVRGDDDRLHVSAADGRPLGWFDLRTGTTRLLDPDAAAEVQRAVDAYAASTSTLRRPVQTLATRPPAPRPTAVREGGAATPEEDLRDRFPGEHVARLLLHRADRTPLARRWWPALQDPLGPALRHAHEAVLGQQDVADALAALAPAWQVLHSVPTSGRSWLDHLLVGPGGVVVLRTAAHPGAAVRVSGSLARAGGRPVSHVRLLRQQRATVAERLRSAGPPTPVRGVVVVVGARSVRTDGLPAGLQVVRLEDLARWVRELPTVLCRVDVARLLETAARASTWPVEVDAAADAGVDAPADVEERHRRREEDRAALDRLTARTRDAARLRRARRAVLLGGSGGVVTTLLLSLRPDVLPQAVAAVGMIGG